ncbi:ester cyclase [Luteimicrobium sp. NPDC057192]|uniref:ester cyclase n=1 Tax=Luteimicrobium sp. NPDC057192 TaxID=3346042 RepID=UPI003643F72F
MDPIDVGERFRRIVEEGIGAGDESVLDAFMAADVEEHQRGNNAGLEGAKGVSRVLHRWMSDFSLTVEDLVVSGAIVWTRNRARGVNTGSVMGFPPTNRPVEVDVFDVGRFEDGKMVEHWGVADQLGLLLQVGFDPRNAPSHA